MPTRSLRPARHARPLLAAAAFCLSACGVASISPIVPPDEAEFDAALLGRWRDAESTEFAVVSGDSADGYSITLVDEDGGTGRFKGRLGRLGGLRILDVWPTQLDLSRDGAVYESLVLRLHSFVVLDRVTSEEVVYRMIEPDSLEALLEKEPLAVAHTLVSEGDGPVITASTADARRFFERLLRQRGAMTDSARYVRQ